MNIDVCISDVINTLYANVDITLFCSDFLLCRCVSCIRCFLFGFVLMLMAGIGLLIFVCYRFKCGLMAIGISV